MEEIERQFKIGSEDDMLANAEYYNEKTLSLKSLEKTFNEFSKQMIGELELLKRQIETIKKSLRG